MQRFLWDIAWTHIRKVGCYISFQAGIWTGFVMMTLFNFNFIQNIPQFVSFGDTLESLGRGFTKIDDMKRGERRLMMPKFRLSGE